MPGPPVEELVSQATPFLLCALSAIVLVWLQIVASRLKRQTGALEGKYLKAFGLWNFMYVAVGASAAAAALTLDAEGLGWITRQQIARAALAYGAFAHVVQGVGFVVSGGRLLERLDSGAAPASDKVVAARRRITRLMKAAGVTSTAIGGILAVLAALPSALHAFYLDALLRRALELCLAAAAAGAGRRRRTMLFDDASSTRVEARPRRFVSSKNEPRRERSPYAGEGVAGASELPHRATVRRFFGSKTSLLGSVRSPGRSPRLSATPRSFSPRLSRFFQREASERASTGDVELQDCYADTSRETCYTDNPIYSPRSTPVADDICRREEQKRRVRGGLWSR